MPEPSKGQDPVKEQKDMVGKEAHLDTALKSLTAIAEKGSRIEFIEPPKRQAVGNDVYYTTSLDTKEAIAADVEATADLEKAITKFNERVEAMKIKKDDITNLQIRKYPNGDKVVHFGTRASGLRKVTIKKD